MTKRTVRDVRHTANRLLAIRTRLVAALAAVAMVVTGGVALDATVAPAPLAHADPSFGTISGTVSFPAAPWWYSASTAFTVALWGQNDPVPTDLVPITYSYSGSSYTITYPDDSGYYNDYFQPGSYTYTVRILPVDPAYGPIFLGGATDQFSATQLHLSPGMSPVSAGNTTVPLLGSISGTVTFPDGPPSAGLGVVAVSAEDRTRYTPATVGADGTYHVIGLKADTYFVGFVPLGDGPGLGAGVYWNSKESPGAAGTVAVAAGQQVGSIDQSFPKGGVVTGRVLDSEGRVVSHVGVAIYDASRSADSYSSLVQQTTANADGTYEFWGLPAGTYKVGFDTGGVGTYASAESVRILDPRTGDVGKKLPSVDIPANPTAATDHQGHLNASKYPYTSAWYTSSAASFSAAKVVTISAGQIVGNINGTLPLASVFTQWQPAERISTTGNPSEKPSSCSCADPVSTLSGEYGETVVDLAIPGSGLPVQLDRSYSSAAAATDGPFGFGSTSTLQSHVVQVAGDSTNPAGTMVVTQENGSTVTFTTVLAGQLYMAPARVHATLTFDWSNNQWVFTRNATEVFRYTSAGALVSHQDLLGNTVTFGTDGSGAVTSISGSGGRSISLTWTGNHVTSASDSAGRTVSYGYDSSGNLTSFTAADGRITTYSYDDSHELTSTTAPGGGTTTNVYDSSGRVTSQSDPLNRTTTFAYSGTAADSTTTMTNPAGTATAFHYVNGILVSETQGVGTNATILNKYTYDAALNLTQKVDGLSKATTMTYDGAGNMLTSTDPLGHTTTYTYDGLHDVLTTVDALGRTSSASYTPTGLKTAATDPTGATSSWTYNPDGTVATSTDPNGNITTYGYDSAGRRTATTDPLQRTTSIAYDAAGHQISSTDGAGDVTTLTVDALGRTLTATDPVGNVTTYTYDAFGNRSSVIAPDYSVQTTSYDLANEPVSQTDALNNTTTTTYTPLGKVATVTNPIGGVTTTTYDAFGRPIITKDPANLATSTSYDNDNRVTQVKTPTGNITKTVYDAAGNKTTVIDPMGNVTTYAYDAANQQVSVTDPLGRVTTTAYDGDGRPTIVTGPDAHTEVTAYDPAGNKTSYTDPDGNVTTYAYDTAEQLITQTAPGGLVTRYAYDGAGRVGVLTKPDGTTITSAYDADGRLLSATPTTGTPASYTYDSLGHRATMTDETGTTSYHYNANGQPTSVTNGANQTVTYGYDNAGRNTTLGYPGSKTVTYTYDADARMTSLTDWSNHKTTFSWTADSQLSKQTDPNKIVSTTSYNKNDLITGINLVNSTAPTISIASYAYGYDAGSQLTSTTIADPLHTTSGGATTTYGYDLRGQITTVSTGGSYVSTPAGFLADTPNGSVRTSNAAQQLESAANPTSASGTSYSYDANGNRSAQTHTLNGDPTSSTSFTYDWSSNLTSAGSVTYTADSDRLRETRTDSNGTKQWLWNTASDQPELLSDGIHQYLYGPSLTPVAQIDSNGTIQYLHGDNIGSVRLVTNASGSITSIADYDAYGDSTWSGAPASFGFAGEWADPATGFIYLRARDYDPATEQFLQVDPAINQTHQPYAYAANSPLASVDPTGLCVGIDGTPQDRICTWNDYFWDSLGPNILAQFKIANAGFSAGSTFGVGLLTNNDEACYGGNAEFWVEYGLGALVSAAGILATGGGSLEALGARGGAGVIEDEVAGADVGTASMSNAADGGMAGVRATGRAGEEMSGIVKNTDRIPSMSGTAAYRVPDELTSTTLGEVKNVSSLSLSGQLRDFESYAELTGRRFILYVRGSTKLSGPLQSQVDAGVIDLERTLPG